VAFLWAAGYIVLPYVSPHLYQLADGTQGECLPDGGPKDPDVKRANGEYPSPSPSFKVVRFSDTGEYVLRCERTDALYELQAIAGPKLVVLYVHGWGHNATSKDHDRFSELIQGLSRAERASTNPRHVVGIYLAWNGASGYQPIDYLNFWSRKSAADQISQWGHSTAFIGAVSSIVRSSDAAANHSQIVLVGHSLGARILFSAVSQHLMYEVTRAHPGKPGGVYKTIQGPADLILLLNPAIEASAYAAFESVRRAQEQFADKQRPLVVTISTDNDDATTYLFPIGQWIGMLRHERDLTTIGNYKNFHTHILSIADKSSDKPRDNAECTKTGCVVRTNMVQPTNPFWMVTTNKTLLNNHNGIWTKEFTGWLQEFIEVKRPEAQ
jgi:pimeloyl-ACP methyl ester carboxylesterase